MGGIIIKIDDLELTFRKFKSPKFPAARIEPIPKIEYSIAGSSIGDGPCFEPKRIWTISASLTPQESDILKAIYSEFDFRRRANPPLQADLILSDFTEYVIERSPRTRLIAEGSNEVLMGKRVKYYAQFKTWITESPTFEEDGIYNLASVTLQETDKLSVGDEGDGDNNENVIITGDKHYTHTQIIASQVWLINHNLNKKPSIRLINDLNQEIRGRLEDVDNNSLKIFFNKPVSGKAYLN